MKEVVWVEERGVVEVMKSWTEKKSYTTIVGDSVEKKREEEDNYIDFKKVRNKNR